MSLLNVIFKLLGWGKKNLGKWLPMIFEAEKKFASASGPQKFALIKELVDKEATKYLRKLQAEANKKGEAFVVANDAKLNALAAKAENMVKKAVEYYNELQALLPHTK